MAMTLRLADDESEALRRRAELEQRSMQDVARQAIREYIENHSRSDLLGHVESAKRLAALGGSDSHATAVPRRRDGAP